MKLLGVVRVLKLLKAELSIANGFNATLGVGDVSEQFSKTVAAANDHTGTDVDSDSGACGPDEVCSLL